MAWHAKEVVRSIYEITDDELASEFVEQLGQDFQDHTCPPEVRSLGRTIVRWRVQIVSWHQALVSNGPTEAVNKRIGCGFRREPTTAPACCCSTPASRPRHYSSPSLPAEIR
jgi:transposase